MNTRQMAHLCCALTFAAAAAARADPHGFHGGVGAGWAFPLEGHGVAQVPSFAVYSLEAMYELDRFYLAASGQWSIDATLEQGTLLTTLSTTAYTVRGGFLFGPGPVSAFAGGGLGYVSQHFTTNERRTDSGLPDFGGPDISNDGAGATVEAGVILFRGDHLGRVILSADVLLPFFSFTTPDGAVSGQWFPVARVQLKLLL